jgi:hypothetical protein
MGNVSSSYDDAKILIGKTLSEARNYIEINNVFFRGRRIRTLRIVERDQFGSYIANSYTEYCLDIYLENDLIVDMY